MGQLYASSLGTLVCKCALEKKEVMGGADSDTSLQEREGAAVAELVAPINPDMSLTPHFAYVEESWASCRRLLCQPHHTQQQPGLALRASSAQRGCACGERAQVQPDSLQVRGQPLLARPSMPS